MFRSAATKIAHNSTLPALAGNKDLRPLQELITSEKAVLQSLQRLSADLMKSSDALRHWGAGEGDDLQDTLTASTTLIGYVAAAFSQLATHEQTIREYMKAVRSREENLDELRRRRKAVSAKSDSAEKRLTKMGAEHKSLQQQTELLNNLREQIRNMDWEILSDEARLSDFKRSSTRNWMMLKFGGLLECAEKATIVSEIGKLVIEEIPLGTTQPGQVRAFYTGHEKTEKLIAEAQRCVAEVVFDPEPDSPSAAKSQQPAGSTASTIDGLPTGSSRDSAAYLQDTSDGSGFGSGLGADEFGGLGDNQGPRGYGTMPAPSSSIRIGDDGSRQGSNFNANSNSNASSSFASPPASAPGSRFGGQFSTFPLRKASIPGGTSSPPPPPAPGLSFQPLEDGSTSSFAAEVADAFALAGKDGGALPTPVPGKTSLDGPAPLYEAHTWDSSAGNGLPRGAAPPAERNPWDSGSAHPPPHPSEYSAAGEGSLIPPSPMEEDEHTESDSEAHLAYAAPPTPQLQSPRLSDERADPSRHVHFNGGQSDSGPNVSQDSRAAKDAPHPGEAPVPYEHDEHALSAAAAREVAREMDALSFSPPSGPPPSFSHIREPNSQSFSAPSGPPPSSFNTDRVPSPLVPPAPPFAQPQQKSSSGSDYTNNVAPRSEGIFSSSRTSLRGSSPNVDTFSQSAGNTAPSSPIVVQQPRPTMNPHSSSPSVSFNSPSVYSTPPEMPAALPLRSGSPASPSMLSPGTRTISAAAFKRSQMRSPSGTQPQGERGSLPDVSPLSLRKKGGPGLPGSPYPRDASPHPVPVPGQESYGSQQEPRPRRSTDSVQQPPQDYENSYDFISSYGDPVGGGSPTQTKLANPNAERGGSPGYAGGNFATNLERENLR